MSFLLIQMFIASSLFLLSFLSCYSKLSKHFHFICKFFLAIFFATCSLGFVRILIILVFFIVGAYVSHYFQDTISFSTLKLLRLCKTSLAINLLLPYLVLFCFYFFFYFYFLFLMLESSDSFLCVQVLIKIFDCFFFHVHKQQLLHNIFHFFFSFF
jgi:hypothetical protein